jgi:spore maturation protein CgeB
MRVLCVLPKYNYGDPARQTGYEVKSFIPALHRLGHDVRTVLTWTPEVRSFEDLNRQILREAEAFRPDVILAAQMHYEVWNETWAMLRAAGFATVNWCTDDSWKYAEFSRFVAPCFDVMATTCEARLAAYAEDGHDNSVLTQWAADPARLLPPLRASECRIPVSFAGSRTPARAEWIRQLADLGVPVQCYGYGWGDAVTSDELSEIFRNSVVSLNLAAGAAHRFADSVARANQIKARTFEVPGAGGFLLTENAPGLERYYVPERDIATFDNVRQAAAQIQRFLSDPALRDRIADAGYERTVREHTYDMRLAPLLETALERRNERMRMASAPAPIDWAAFERAVSAHAAPAWSAVYRGLMRGAGSLLFGQRRALRLARRMLYEVSWRVERERTYSAAGLPGRVFDAFW